VQIAITTAVADRDAKTVHGTRREDLKVFYECNQTDRLTSCLRYLCAEYKGRRIKRS